MSSKHVCNIGCPRNASSFETSRVVNHSDALGRVMLFVGAVGLDLELVAASFPYPSRRIGSWVAKAGVSICVGGGLYHFS